MSSPVLPRNALVTGGHRRIGRAIVLRLIQAGFTVAVHVRERDSDAARLLAEITATGGTARLFAADLANEAATATLIGQVHDAMGPIGLLVNNASNFRRDEWHDADRASWDAHLEPNLRTPFVLMQHFARQLPEGADGVIVNMLDQRVWSPTPHFISYSLSKAGLWALTQSMALALAPRIRVCAIGPGFTLPSQGQSPAQFARQVAATPLRRGPDPGEIAEAVLAILAMPSFTGQMLALDGGQHLQWSPAAMPT